MLSPYFASHSGHFDKEMQSRSYFTTYPKVVSQVYSKTALLSQTASSALWQRFQADADLPCILVNAYHEIIRIKIKPSCSSGKGNQPSVKTKSTMTHKTRDWPCTVKLLWTSVNFWFHQKKLLWYLTSALFEEVCPSNHFPHIHTFTAFRMGAARLCAKGNRYTMGQKELSTLT